MERVPRVIFRPWHPRHGQLNPCPLEMWAPHHPCSLPHIFSVSVVTAIFKVVEMSIYDSAIGPIPLLAAAGHANQDGNAVARDEIYIIRDTGACPNKGGSGSAPPVSG